MKKKKELTARFRIIPFFLLLESKIGLILGFQADQIEIEKERGYAKKKKYYYWYFLIKTK